MTLTKGQAATALRVRVGGGPGRRLWVARTGNEFQGKPLLRFESFPSADGIFDRREAIEVSRRCRKAKWRRVELVPT